MFFIEDLPPAEQLETVKNLIQCGIDQGYIMANYTLLGHRQVRDTECPGDALFEEIKTWSHWSSTPERAPSTHNPDIINEIPT